MEHIFSDFLPEDVDDVTTDFEQPKHLVEGIHFQMRFTESPQGSDNVIVLCSEPRGNCDED